MFTVLLLVVALLVFAFGTGNLSTKTYDITLGQNPTATVSATAQATCDLHTRHCTKAPLMAIDANKQYVATVTTARGDFVITLDAKHAPNAVNNFVFLAQTRWYDGTYFWRVEQPGKPSPLDNQPSDLSLVQGGSVTDNGNDPQDVPGYTIQDDPVVGDYTPGTVAMANTGVQNSGSAQFFIDTADESKFFSKTYPIFGQVARGMNVVRAIQPKDKIESITITER